MALAAVVMLLTAALPAPAAAESLPADGNILPVEDAGLTPADPPEEPVLSGSAEGQDGSGAGQSDAGQGQNGSGEGLGGSGQDPDGSGGGQNSSGEGTSTPAEIQPDLEEQPGELPVQAAPLMAPRSSPGMSAEDPIEVPPEGLAIKNGTFYGVTKTWFQSVNPDKGTVYLSIAIPDNVTTIANDAFRYNYTSGKQSAGAVTSSDGLGGFNLSRLDFTQATSLTEIQYQAAMKCTCLTGELDLSATKLTTIGKSSFSGCTGLTGVILPSTLKNLGTKDGGSVFNGCSGLQYVRTAGKDPDAVFQLPDGLKVLGKQSFQGCTGLPAGTTVTIPSSVTYVGGDVFNNTASITAIVVETSDASGYEGTAFRNNTPGYGLGKRLIIFSSAEAKNSFKPSGFTTYKNACTYEFTLHYGNAPQSPSEPKLWGQAVNICKGADGSWAVDENYGIPPVDPGDVPVGYAGGWAYAGKLVAADTVLKPAGNDLYLDVQNVVVNPTVTWEVTGGRFIGADAGVWQMEAELTDAQPTSRIGVKVDHPLLQGKPGTEDDYVYFKYAWWDEYENGVNGPRTDDKDDSKIFSTARTSMDYTRKFSEATIPISDLSHERSDGNYYLVEIFGYHVVKGGEPELFYKSNHNFIGGQPGATVLRTYLFNVTVTDSTNPNPPGPGPDSGSGSSSGSSRQEKKTVDLRVEVRWEGDGPHPDGVPVQLLRRGESWGDPVTLSAAGGWQYRWTRLEDADWTVAPAGTVPGYTASVERDGACRFVITCRPAAAPSKNPDTGR